MEHTPTNWRVDRIRPGIVRFNDDPLTGILVGQHAEFVARACRCHQWLLAALVEGERVFRKQSTPEEEIAWFSQARAAIAAAESEAP